MKEKRDTEMSEHKDYEQEDGERVTIVASYTFVSKSCGCIDCAADGYNAGYVCLCHCHDEPEESE